MNQEPHTSLSELKSLKAERESKPQLFTSPMLSSESHVPGGQPLPAHHVSPYHMPYPAATHVPPQMHMGMGYFSSVPYGMMCSSESFMTASQPQPQPQFMKFHHPCFTTPMPSSMGMVGPSHGGKSAVSLGACTALPAHPPISQGGGTLASHASASDSCSQISHVLQCYQQGGEDPEFVRKAIESLVKKLKDKRIELDALITAVTSAGKTPSQCVTIQRSLDGRLQVAGRKGVPHVVYARIWRWPQVTKGELQKLPCCAISADNQDFICINPYHYERIVASTYGPMDMSSLRIDPTQIPPPFTGHQQGYGSQQQQHMMGSQDPSSSQVSNHSESQPMDVQCGISQMDEWQGCYPTTSHYGCVPNYSPPLGMSTSPGIDVSRLRIPPLYLLPFPAHWASISCYELDTQIGETFKVPSERREVVVDGGMDPLGEREGRLCLGALSNVHRTEASEKARLHIGNGVLLRWEDEQMFIEVLSLKPVFLRSPYLDLARGQPSGSVVHRLTNQNSNVGAGGIKIFDLRWAYQQMRDQTESARQAVAVQAAAVAGVGYPNPAVPLRANLSDVLAGSGVDEMQRQFCSVGIAFVKGWGLGYNRKTIKDTPCWIEVQLNRPLQILDLLLKKGLQL